MLKILASEFSKISDCNVECACTYCVSPVYLNNYPGFYIHISLIRIFYLYEPKKSYVHGGSDTDIRRVTSMVRITEDLL